MRRDPPPPAPDDKPDWSACPHAWWVRVLIDHRWVAYGILAAVAVYVILDVQEANYNAFSFFRALVGGLCAYVLLRLAWEQRPPRIP